MKFYKTKKEAIKNNPDHRWLYSDKDKLNNDRWFTSKRLLMRAHKYLWTQEWFTSIEQYQKEFGFFVRLPRGIIK